MRFLRWFGKVAPVLSGLIAGLLWSGSRALAIAVICCELAWIWWRHVYARDWL